MEVQFHTFLTLALLGDEYSSSHPGQVTMYEEGKRFWYPTDRNQLGPTPVRDAVKINFQTRIHSYPPHSLVTVLTYP
jgi:hypothetical protein